MLTGFYNSGIARWGSTGQGVGERAQSHSALWGSATLPVPHVLSQRETLRAPSFGIFIQVSFCRQY